MKRRRGREERSESLSLTLKRITARAVLFHGLPNAPCCVPEWKIG